MVCWQIFYDQCKFLSKVTPHIKSHRLTVHYFLFQPWPRLLVEMRPKSRLNGPQRLRQLRRDHRVKKETFWSLKLQCKRSRVHFSQAEVVCVYLYYCKPFKFRTRFNFGHFGQKTLVRNLIGPNWIVLKFKKTKFAHFCSQKCTRTISSYFAQFFDVTLLKRWICSIVRTKSKQ